MGARKFLPVCVTGGDWCRKKESFNVFISREKNVCSDAAGILGMSSPDEAVNEKKKRRA